MTEPRNAEQRKADALSALASNSDLWVATASPDGRPHVIAASSCWDGSQLVITTQGNSRTARNLRANGRGRLILGTPSDATMVDVTVARSVPAEAAPPELARAFEGATGWNPAEVGAGWHYFCLLPVRIQSFRGYDELHGRDVMTGSRWRD